jgi:hypothetical protein
MVGLAAAKDRGATVRGGVPATQDATGSTSTQTKTKGNQPTLDSSPKAVNFGDIKGESTDKDHKDWVVPRGN